MEVGFVVDCVVAVSVVVALVIFVIKARDVEFIEESVVEEE
jgi:hypothetical protein